MKIAYVIHSCFNSGGMERVLSVKANYLVEKGYDVHIITMNNLDKPKFFSFDSRIYFFDLQIPCDDFKSKDLFVDKLTAYLIQIKADITVSTGLDLVNYVYLCNDTSKKILELHFAKYRRKFEFAALDNYLLGRLISDFYSFKRTQIARKYDKFVVLSEEDKGHWRYLSNITVIPNPISFSTNIYSTLRNKKVIAVGRFTYQKGLDRLIDIWKQIHVRYPDWTLCIYGNGNRKDNIIQKAKKMNLLPCIEFNEPSKNIASSFADCSIYAMTSRYEGFGLVLSEAMLCGLPVVSYACKCGPRDIIRDSEDGFLIKDGDKKDFISKLSYLIENYEARFLMGHRAKENVRRFDLDTIMSKWINLFDELVNSH